jgi:SAM-dependent methyltransferase
VPGVIFIHFFNGEKMRTNWFESFFRGLALEFWRKAVSREETERDVNFIESEFGLPGGSQILDIPCGNGRHSVELAKRGYAMTSVDLSDEFVEETRHAANENRLRINCSRMDIRALHVDEKLDGAFCFGNSFGYLDRQANAKFLADVSRCLKPQAKFLIETAVTAESLLPGLQLRRWHRVADIIVISENRYDATESQLYTEYTFIRGGVIESGIATYSVYTVAELKTLLSSCGLLITGLYGSRDRGPYRLGDRLFICAKKIGEV